MKRIEMISEKRKLVCLQTSSQCLNVILLFFLTIRQGLIYIPPKPSGKEKYGII